jgi:hypothetical protein
MGERRTQNVSGRDALIREMQRKFGTRTMSAQVGMKGSTGKQSSVDGIAEGGRSAGQNVIIIRSQMKKRRNPVFTDNSESKIIQQMWAQSINKFMRGNATALTDGATRIAERIILFSIAHIEQGRNVRGKMRELTQPYERFKEARWGKQPILRASGQLMDSFKADFKLVKN